MNPKKTNGQPAYGPIPHILKRTRPNGPSNTQIRGRKTVMSHIYVLSTWGRNNTCWNNLHRLHRDFVVAGTERQSPELNSYHRILAGTRSQSTNHHLRSILLHHLNHHPLESINRPIESSSTHQSPNTKIPNHPTDHTLQESNTRWEHKLASYTKPLETKPTGRNDLPLET